MRPKVGVMEIPDIVHQTLLRTEQQVTITQLLNSFRKAFDAIDKFYEKKLRELIDLKFQRPGKCSNLIWTCQKDNYDFEATLNNQQVRDTKFNMYKHLVDKSAAKEALLQSGFSMHRSIVRYLGYSLPFFVTRVEEIVEVVHAVNNKCIHCPNICNVLILLHVHIYVIILLGLCCSAHISISFDKGRWHSLPGRVH